jgi:hypothetical protein
MRSSALGPLRSVTLHSPILVLDPVLGLVQLAFLQFVLVPVVARPGSQPTFGRPRRRESRTSWGSAPSSHRA